MSFCNLIAASFPRFKLSIIPKVKIECCIRKLAYESVDNWFKKIGIEMKDKKIDNIPGSPEMTILLR